MKTEIGRLLSLLTDTYNQEPAMSSKVEDLFARLLEEEARITSAERKLL